MIRVAIADDSPFTCGLLASYIEESGECEVVGLAHDALAAADLVRRAQPDVLTLDLQMPGCDGLDLLRRLTADSPVAVVVISGVTRLAAATTLHALELGAVDFVLKYTPGAPVSRASLKREIVSKVKMAAAARPSSARPFGVAAAPSVAPALPARPNPAARKTNGSGVVVIGASTGGPRAVTDLLTQLPADFAAPCVIVQHLPATFTAPFAAQLGRHTHLRVQEAASGDRLEAGAVLVTPGALHLVLRDDGRLELQQPADRDVYRPSIDVTMRSAADAYGASAVGVLLSGMGNDGVEGLKRIRDAGGDTYAQDPASCVVASMPQRAIERGAPQHVALPARIGQMLAARGRA